MPLVSVSVSLCILILSEANLTWAHFDAMAIHRLDEPAARERNDPLRLGVFVPGAFPTHRLDGDNDGGPVSFEPVLPLGIRRRIHALQGELMDSESGNVADPGAIGPHVPVRNCGRLFSVGSLREWPTRREECSDYGEGFPRMARNEITSPVA